MQLPRSFFLALLVFPLLAASTIPALAADKESTPPPEVPAKTQTTLTRGPYARQFLARAGLLSTQGETRLDPGHRFQSGSTLLDGIDTNPFQAVLEDQAKSQPAPEAQMANADGVCYTMRMYKVKATERLAGGESASRGYSTCELARNYQIRSAVLHEQTVEAPKAQSQQK